MLERRGAAHVGAVARHAVGPVGRDCLHWCVAPGVLDALALSMLGQLADEVSKAPSRAPPLELDRPTRRRFMQG